MHRSTPLPRLDPVVPLPPPLVLVVSILILCRMGHTANIFFSSCASTNSTAVLSPRSTTFNIPCHTLSRQSPPRHPPLVGLGGSLNTCALCILRRIRSMISSSGGCGCWDDDDDDDAAIEEDIMLVGSLVVLGKRMDDEDDDVEVLLLWVAVVLGANADEDDKDVDFVVMALERAVARFNIILWRQGGGREVLGSRLYRLYRLSVGGRRHAAENGGGGGERRTRTMVMVHAQ